MAFAAPLLAFVTSAATKVAAMAVTAGEWVIANHKILLPLIDRLDKALGKDRSPQVERILQVDMETIRSRVRPELLKIHEAYHKVRTETLSQFLQALSQHSADLNLGATLHELEQLIKTPFDATVVDKELSETLTTQAADFYKKTRGGTSMMISDLLREGVKTSHATFRKEVSENLDHGQQIVNEHLEAKIEQMVKTRIEMEALDLTQGDNKAKADAVDRLQAKIAALKALSDQVSKGLIWVPAS